MMTFEQRCEAFNKLYPDILKQSLGANSPFDELKTLLKELFTERVIKSQDEFNALTQSLVALGQSVTATSAQSAISLITEGELNEAKIRLLEAQIATEAKKPALIARQTTQIDDNKRIEAAKVAQSYSFGLAAGGLDIPQEVYDWVKQKVTAIG